MDAITVTHAAFLKALATVKNLHVKAWLEKHSATFRLNAAWTQEFETWALTWLNALEQQCERLNEQCSGNAENVAALQALLADHQFFRVNQNYIFEATREAMDERKRMLAFAAAGSVNVALALGEIARVERTIRELDPDGVRLLSAIAARDGGDDFNLEEASSYACFASLETSGCVSVDWIEADFVVVNDERSSKLRNDPAQRLPRLRRFGKVSPTGSHVVAVMTGYLNATADAELHPSQL